MTPDEYQSRRVVQTLAAEIRALAEPGRHYKIMHVCGSHEHSLGQWGLRTLLPANVELIAGPGCPVCVCPEHEIQEAIAIAERGAVVLTYGDMLRVPTASGSLQDAAARGLAVRLVYSAHDAAKIAATLPERQVCFFAVGFETTAAPTAALLNLELPANLSVLTAHRLTPPAMDLLLQSGEIEIDALIAPGHVSVIIGAEPWRLFADKFHLPTVVAGFEPVDLMLAVRAIIGQLNAGRAELGNVYERVVSPRGNLRAQAAMARVFRVGQVHWRGLGDLPDTGLLLREELGDRDARRRFGVALEPAAEALPKGCQCNRVMLGQIKPDACPLFRTACHPLHPYGPCMVSQEGTCYIWHQYGGPALATPEAVPA